MRVRMNGNGYEEVRVEDGETRRALPHHRILSWVWGGLDSPFFEEDAREVHHVEPVEWLNTEENLRALTPAEHREVDPGRAQIRAPWDHADGRVDS